MRRITINGKTPEQIAKELQEPFPDEAADINNEGFLYFPIEVYEERLNEVIGFLNYDRITSHETITEVAGKYVVSVTTALHIYDDEGNVVLRKTSPGAANLIILERSGQPKSLKSDIASAASESFKNCCKMLQIGMNQVRKDRKDKKQKSGNLNGTGTAMHTEQRQQVLSRKSDKKSEPIPESSLFHLRLLSDFSAGKSFYSANVLDLDTKETLKLMIFERERPRIENYMEFPVFLRSYTTGRELRVYGYTKLFREEYQLIFTDVLF